MQVFNNLFFYATNIVKGERVDGTLIVDNISFPAVSGSKSLLPLPQGLYVCSNLRFRSYKEKVGKAMHRNEERDAGGLCFPPWSVDLEPQFSTWRTALRIHPDGNFAGTGGCIGVLKDVDKCYDVLKGLLAGGKQVRLIVHHDGQAVLTKPKGYKGGS